MKNASKIAMEFNAMLPAAECPEHTEGREGFYHLCGMQGDESGAVLQYILRDHDAAKLETKEAMMLAAEAFLNQKYGAGTVRVTLKDSYRNMREVIDRYPEVTQRALDAIRSAGDEPQIVAIRGGTDGARLSWEGLPCPNLPTGGYNYHGVREWIPARSLDQITDVLVDLVVSFAE